MTRKIALSQHKFAIVDDGDYERLSGYRWCARKHGKGFVALRAYRKHQDRKEGNLYMHRAILDAPPEISVRHYDRNGLNNVRKNLYTVPRQGWEEVAPPPSVDRELSSFSAPGKP